jgi:hypothetical protein
MSGRPALPAHAKRVRVQVFLEPAVAKAVNHVHEMTGMPLSNIVARMAKAGAKQTLIEIVEEQKKEATLVPPHQPQEGAAPDAA